MVVDVGRKIIYPVGKVDQLGIGVFLTHLFYTTVDVPAMRLQAFYHLTLEGNHQTQHPVC